MLNPVIIAYDKRRGLEASEMLQTTHHSIVVLVAHYRRESLTDCTDNNNHPANRDIEGE